jgi:hypothetical protein
VGFQFWNSDDCFHESPEPLKLRLLGGFRFHALPSATSIRFAAKVVNMGWNV